MPAYESFNIYINGQLEAENVKFDTSKIPRNCLYWDMLREQIEEELRKMEYLPQYKLEKIGIVEKNIFLKEA